jgi:hypothetical protein
MPADYLSQLPFTNENQLAEVTQCFDPFQPELIDLQKADQDLQKMHHFWTKGEWPTNVSKSDANYLQNLAAKLYQDANKIVWIRLYDYKYPRTALFLPKIFQKWHSVKLTTINLEATMQPSKPTSGSYFPTTGPEFTRIF